MHPRVNCDALDRTTGVTYTPSGTPAVTYSYDSASVSNGKGRRTGMTDSASGTKTYYYDILGRVTRLDWQTTSFTQRGDFVYNLAGAMTESKWPGIYDYNSQPLGIYWTYDSAGRQQTAKWSNNGGGAGGTAYQRLVDNYAFTYATTSPYGTEALTNDGTTNGTIETTTYNIRLQPVQRYLKYGTQFRANYNYIYTHPVNGGNNGDVFTIQNFQDRTEDMDYTYDWLNRIWTAAMGGSTLTYYYDVNGDGFAYGNRVKQCGTSTFSQYSSWLATSPSTNWITAARFGTNACTIAPTQPYTHDSAGNLTGTGTTTYEYDQAGRMKSINGGQSSGEPILIWGADVWNGWGKLRRGEWPGQPAIDRAGVPRAECGDVRRCARRCRADSRRVRCRVSGTW